MPKHTEMPAPLLTEDLSPRKQAIVVAIRQLSSELDAFDAGQDRSFLAWVVAYAVGMMDHHAKRIGEKVTITWNQGPR